MNSSNSSGETLKTLSRDHETCSGNHVTEFCRARKLFDALHKILVACSIRCDKFPNDGDCTEAPPLVDTIKYRIVHLAELQTRKDSSGLKNPISFLQSSLLISKIANPKCNSVEVDGIAFYHRQFFCIGFKKIESISSCVACSKTSFSPLCKHLRIYIRDGDRSLRIMIDMCGVVEHSECNISCTTSDIQDLPSLVGFRGSFRRSRIQ